MLPEHRLAPFKETTQTRQPAAAFSPQYAAAKTAAIFSCRSQPDDAQAGARYQSVLRSPDVEMARDGARSDAIFYDVFAAACAAFRRRFSRCRATMPSAYVFRR